MRYVVFICEDIVAVRYAELLLKEVDRFDNRAQFLVVNSEPLSIDLKGELSTSRSKKKIKQFKGEAFFCIGRKPNAGLAKSVKRNRLKSYFFQITSDFVEGERESQKAIGSFDKVYTDIPRFAKGSLRQFPGHFLTDIIRKGDFSHSTENSDQGQASVLFVCSSNRDCRFTQKVKDKLGSKVIGVEIGPEQSFLGEENRLDTLLKSLKQANAAVVFTDLDELMAAFMSCPAVRVTRGTLFSKPKMSIIDRILDKSETVNRQFNVTRAAALIHKMLNDHEFCADRLIDYQKTIDALGGNPVFRNLSQQLVEELDPAY